MRTIQIGEIIEAMFDGLLEAYGDRELRYRNARALTLPGHDGAWVAHAGRSTEPPSVGRFRIRVGAEHDAVDSVDDLHGS